MSHEPPTRSGPFAGSFAPPAPGAGGGGSGVGAAGPAAGRASTLDAHAERSTSDAELIERARHGDRVAFGDLVERYQQFVFRAALAALRSRQDAEEVAQDALVSAFQKLDTFRGEASFKTWLLTITWNRAMDRRRSIGEWLRRFSAPSEDRPFEPPAGGPSHETTLIARESRREVRRMLMKLPVKYRDALLLSASGEHTFDEIGRILGVPTGTAKWRAMEGRRLLKQKLVGRGIVGHALEATE